MCSALRKECIRRGGGQSHSRGDAYVRLKRPPFSASLSPKDPSFFIIACALTQRPHNFLYFSLTECQISLTEWKKSCSHQVTPHFRPIRPHIFGFFSHRMPKIMLSPNDPSFFEPVLSPNAPACRSAGLTPVSISKMTAPPGALECKILQINPLSECWPEFCVYRYMQMRSSSWHFRSKLSVRPLFKILRRFSHAILRSQRWLMKIPKKVILASV